MIPHSFVDTFSVLLLFSTLTNGNENNDKTLYGICYQFNTPSSNSPQIILSTQHERIYFEDYGFETSSTDPIDCIWFTSNEYAHTASTMSTQTAAENFNNDDNVQTAAPGQKSPIYCNNQRIDIADTSNIISKHLCSDFCYADHKHSCSSLVRTRSIPLSYQGNSNVSPLIPSMFGISGICIAFIVVCAVIYFFAVKYSRWTEEKSGNETEQVIGDVLEEIAKYTIGDDDEEGFYGDWMDDDDSDRSESSHSMEEALGMTILRVVSHQQEMPEIPNPSISSSSSSEEESDEEQCREDLKVAKETLYATTYGTDNVYLTYIRNLSPINEKIDDNEQVIEKKVDINNSNTSKKSPLLHGSGGESSDYKISSDGCTNSDLP